MPRDLTDEAQVCYEHAEWCSRQAEGVKNRQVGEDFSRLAEKWLRLARSCKNCAVGPITKRDEQAEITGQKTQRGGKRQCLSGFLLSLAVLCSFHSSPDASGRVPPRPAQRRCQIAQSIHRQHRRRYSVRSDIVNVTCRTDHVITDTESIIRFFAKLGLGRSAVCLCPAALAQARSSERLPSR